jgi:hypothetical protein
MRIVFGPEWPAAKPSATTDVTISIVFLSIALGDSGGAPLRRYHQYFIATIRSYAAETESFDSGMAFKS